MKTLAACYTDNKTRMPGRGVRVIRLFLNRAGVMKGVSMDQAHVQQKVLVAKLKFPGALNSIILIKETIGAPCKILAI
jgi:hypothetical protein